MNRALRGRPELLALVRRVIVDTVAPTMALVTSHVSNVITGTAYRTALPDCSTYDSIRDTKYESQYKLTVLLRIMKQNKVRRCPLDSGFEIASAKLQKC